MDTVLLEILLIALLIILNSFFACAEFAIISIRKSRVAQLVAEGDDRAKIIEDLQKDPHRLLAVVQVGVTIIGSTASALGGVIAVTHLKPVLAASSNRIISDAAEPVAVFIVVAILSYFTLVIGELAPKTIGLQYADPAALHFAKPLNIFARFGAFAVSFLSASSRAVLRLLGMSGQKESFITREEVQHMVSEGHEAGAFTAAENEYIKNIFDFTHTAVREVMVPRTRMSAIDLHWSNERILATVLDTQYSRYPVYRGDLEELCGFIHAKDLLEQMVKNRDFDVPSIVREPFYVPEGKMVNDLLKEMQRKKVHMAIVVDEYGGLSGVVTTEDLLEELVGEIEDEHDVGEPLRIQKTSEGGYLIDALLSVNDLEDLLDIEFEEDHPYDTIAGMIIHRLGRFPEKGEGVEWEGYLFNCEEVAKNAIRRVRITPKG